MRFWAALLTAMLMLSIGSLWVYHSYENKTGSVGPVFLTMSRGENLTNLVQVSAYTPTSSLVEASCYGNGSVEVYDILTGKLIDRHPVHGHAKYQLVLPHEGDYLIINNGTEVKATCSFRFLKNYPTKEVQNAVYLSGSVFALLLAFIVWRWVR
ncbi:hypothetical protein [Thermococcus zilligii]|uniref:hypothetical protein n=1 Tax=Thermococcus zilligii TaxID=54076 RepID=UPI00029A0D2E|nr:hypothetical protein [Thermococcus zilligii]